jgi:hypothetical protein
MAARAVENPAEIQRQSDENTTAFPQRRKTL